MTFKTGTVGAASLEAILGAGAHGRGRALRDRAATLIEVTGGVAPSEPAEAAQAVGRLIRSGDPALCWLAMSVMASKFPSPVEVETLLRRVLLGDETSSGLVEYLQSRGQLDATSWVDVSVQSGGVMVDVDHTGRYSFGTGIQRVARETVRRWADRHDVALVAWTYHFDAYRRLNPDEHARAIGMPARLASTETREPDAHSAVVVPWRTTVLVPELPVERLRSDAFAGVARYSQSTTGVVGFDCVPLTMAETTAEGMPVAFLHYLAACAHVTRIAAISATAAAEYQGWRAMLSSRGISGPRIEAVELASQPGEPTGEDLLAARNLFGVGPLPIVLVVGSHEPRKNHLVVLQAAEALWRSGLRFALAFLGGNSWKSARFFERVEGLQKAGRPIQVVSAVSDSMLWAAYRQAACSVFVSLHEGFGLPVVESLLSGTPVITSCYGAMADAARDGGCLLVDPRQPADVARALRSLLTDSELAAKLRREAAGTTRRSWDDYAERTWDFLAQGVFE